MKLSAFGPIVGYKCFQFCTQAPSDTRQDYEIHYYSCHFTPEASICHGGHHYAMSNMSDALYGLMHTFIAPSLLTNTEHTADSRMLLQRMVSHVYSCTVAEEFEPSAEQPIPTSMHIPRFDTSEGVRDFFNLLNAAELDVILNPSSYKTGVLLPRDRVRMVHVRKLSRILLRWFWCKYQIRYMRDGEDRIVEDGEQFYYRALGRQTKSLLQYKITTEKCGIQLEETECSAEKLKTLINGVFNGNSDFWEAFNETTSASLDCYEFPFTAEVRQLPIAFSLDDCSKIITPYHPWRVRCTNCGI